MKKPLAIITIFFLLGCTAWSQKKDLPNILDMINQTNDTIISKPKPDMILNNYRTFNFDLFKNQYVSGVLKDYEFPGSGFVCFEAPDGTWFRSTFKKEGDYKNRLSIIIPSLKSFEHYIYYYYPSGKLYKTEQYADAVGEWVKIGKSYTYSEDGKVIQEEDHDKRFYNITFDKVLLFLESKGHIDIKTGRNRDKVSFQFFEKSKVWEVSFMYLEVEGIREEYTNYYIDTKTGKLLETRQQTIFTYPIDVPWYRNKPYIEKYSDANWETGVFIDADKEIYKTHEGKNYTRAEWKKFDDEQYAIYLKNRSKKGFFGRLLE